MATRFVTNLDLVQNQILNGRFETLATDPTTDNFEGRLIYNSTEKVLKVYDGTVFRKALHQITSGTTALTTSESNGSVALSIADAINGGASGLLAGADKQKLDNATAVNTNGTLVLRDSGGRFQASAPATDLDVANKAYVDAARQGLDVKASVRVATATALPSFSHLTGVLTASSNGALVVDGITVAAGDRVLVKNETTAANPYNGIYVVTETGDASTSWVLTRSEDADSSLKVTPGLFTFVEEGTVNADAGFVLISDGSLTLGTSDLDFALFSFAGTIMAGDGLSKNGDVLDVNVAADGGLEIVGDDLEIKIDAAVSGLTTTTDGLAVDSSIAGGGINFTAGVLSVELGNNIDGILFVSNGGTGASTAAEARTNLADTSSSGQTSSTPVLARIASQAIGNGSNTSFAVVHNFGTRNVVVQVFDSSSFDTVIADVIRTDTNTVTVQFSAAPSSGAFTVVVTG